MNRIRATGTARIRGPCSRGLLPRSCRPRSPAPVEGGASGRARHGSSCGASPHAGPAVRAAPRIMRPARPGSSSPRRSAERARPSWRPGCAARVHIEILKSRWRAGGNHAEAISAVESKPRGCRIRVRPGAPVTQIWTGERNIPHEVSCFDAPSRHSASRFFSPSRLASRRRRRSQTMEKDARGDPAGATFTVPAGGR